VILDERRTELGRGQGGPCNIATCDDDTLRDSVRAATQSALAAAALPPDIRFASVCAGVAGYTAKRRRADFLRLLPRIVPAERHRLEPDFVIAYWGAAEGEPGVIVSAGTGAVAYGRNAEGKTWRVDGRGFLLGDSGSGFDIGRMALWYTARQLDRDQPLDDFSRRVLASIEAQDIEDLIEWVYRDFQAARIAGLAEAVGHWASAGDEIARVYIEQAGYALRRAASAVLRKLQMPVDTPIYLLGSIWNIGEILLKPFQFGAPRSIRPLPVLTIRPPGHDAAYGAALLAMQPGD
jgi:N-acetylglucosamine kinase